MSSKQIETSKLVVKARTWKSDIKSSIYNKGRYFCSWEIRICKLNTLFFLEWLIDPRWRNSRNDAAAGLSRAVGGFRDTDILAGVRGVGIQELKLRVAAIQNGVVTRSWCRNAGFCRLTEIIVFQVYYYNRISTSKVFLCNLNYLNNLICVS